MPYSVLHLCSSAGVFGAETVLLSLANEMQGTDFKPIVGSFNHFSNPNFELVEQARKVGIRTVVFPCKRRMDLKTIFLIRNFISKENIDLVHSHGYKANLYSLAVSYLTKNPILATCHNWTMRNRRLSFYASIDKFVLARFNFVVSVSEDLKIELVRFGIPSNRIKTIFNGISMNRFLGMNDKKDLRKEYAIPQEANIIGTVGRLSPEKGTENFLKAAKEVLTYTKNVRFIIVGDGPLLKNLQQTCSSLGIKEYVIFAGRQTNIKAFYDFFDIFVLPSLNEGFPIALLEAMFLGKPSVLSGVGAIPQVIQNGKDGLLVHPGDPIQLADSIKYFLKNKENASQFGINARKKVMEVYSSKVMTEEYLKIYENLILSKQKAFLPFPEDKRETNSP